MCNHVNLSLVQQVIGNLPPLLHLLKALNVGIFTGKWLINGWHYLTNLGSVCPIRLHKAVIIPWLVCSCWRPWVSTGDGGEVLGAAMRHLTAGVLRSAGCHRVEECWSFCQGRAWSCLSIHNEHLAYSCLHLHESHLDALFYQLLQFNSILPYYVIFYS